jgi:dienelactone hydrolase
MELLAFEKAWRLPFGLAALPEGAVEHPVQGVVGAILLYPYCGAANRARRVGWRLPAPTLFLLAGEDSIAPAEDCLEVAARLEAEGLPVETVVFDGVTHGFDQQERAPFSLLEFDAEATAEALRVAGEFLDRIDPGPAPDAGAAPPGG